MIIKYILIFVMPYSILSADNLPPMSTSHSAPTIGFYKQEIEKIDKELSAMRLTKAKMDEFDNTFKRVHADLYIEKQKLDQDTRLAINARMAEILTLNMDKLKEIKISQYGEIQIPNLEIPPSEIQKNAQTILQNGKKHDLKFEYLYKSELLKICRENKK